jgi:hypothetical protein
VRRIVFRDDQAAAGVLIQAMNDAWSGHTTDAAQLAFAMVKQRIDEGVLLVSGSGMNDYPGDLVDYQ